MHRRGKTSRKLRPLRIRESVKDESILLSACSEKIKESLLKKLTQKKRRFTRENRINADKSLTTIKVRQHDLRRLLRTTTTSERDGERVPDDLVDVQTGKFWIHFYTLDPMQQWEVLNIVVQDNRPIWRMKILYGCTRKDNEIHFTLQSLLSDKGGTKAILKPCPASVQELVRMFEERWGKKRESHCAGFTRSGQANEGVFHNIEVPVPGTFLLGMDVDLSVKVDRRQCDYICKVISDIVFAPSYSMDRNRDGSRIGAIAGSQEQKGNGSPFDVAACASEGQNTVDVKDQGAISRANYWRAGPGVNTIHSVPVDYKTYIGHTGYLPVQKQAWETHWDHTAGLTDNEFYRTVPVVDQTGRLAKTDPLGDASNQGCQLESLWLLDQYATSTVNNQTSMLTADFQYCSKNQLCMSPLSSQTWKMWETWSVPSQQSDMTASFPPRTTPTTSHYNTATDCSKTWQECSYN